MAEDAPYGIEDLARLGGVTRRTIRYYVQEGLLAAPRGLGRGRHYGPEHLAQLLAVKALQERGLSLDEVRDELAAAPLRGTLAMDLPMEAAAPPGSVAQVPVARASAVRASAVRASAWQRIELVPGVELHVAGSRPLPSPERLRELAEWCERNLRV